ncbi:MAG: MBL fold metallo-hydrolase [Bacteroidota bacterium]|nr:MBL fold metallo-hydrolase [Bacteroidota bacterium]
MDLLTEDKKEIGKLDIVAPNVARILITMVNVYLLKTESQLEDRWILVDAGIGNCAKKIKKQAAIFTSHSRPPEAIVLTHGHFDHIGAAKELAEEWDVPVYAHPNEFPYLTGKASYPPPDPTVGGGGMTLLSFLYPNGPIDLGDRLRPFPENGIMPEMPEWKIIETPGHSPGHVSLYRESDKILIVGDAFVTVKQESTLAVMTQKKEIHGPPTYFTCDWIAAKASVERLAALNPTIAATGHGVPINGETLKNGLQNLAENFDKLAKPSNGRYINDPALTNEQGVSYLPPAIVSNKAISIILAGTVIGITLLLFLNSDED